MSHDHEPFRELTADDLAAMRRTARPGDSLRQEDELDGIYRELERLKAERNALHGALVATLDIVEHWKALLLGRRTERVTGEAQALLDSFAECSICRRHHPHGAPEHACE